MTLSLATLVNTLNDNPPPFIQQLKGRIQSMDHDTMCAEIDFTISLDFCHSGNIVQGGFVTAMLDAAMSNAVFSALGYLAPLPTLDIHVSFLAPSLAGKFRAEGRVVRMGKSVGFLEGSLYDPAGELTATAVSTAKIIRRKE